MSLAELYFALRPLFQDYRRNLIKTLAFMMKYGHQPLSELLHTPTPLLIELSQGIASIMEDEKENFERQLSSEM